MMNDEAAAAIEFPLAALRRAQPANEPLTLEQLREMDGDKISHPLYRALQRLI